MKKTRRKRIIRRRRRISEKEIMRIKRKLKKSARKLRLGAKRTGAYVYGTLRRIVGNPAIPANMGNPEYVSAYKRARRMASGGRTIGIYAFRSGGTWRFGVGEYGATRLPGDELVTVFNARSNLRGNPKKSYAQRVRELENEGATTSDAQAVAEVELMEGRLRAGSDTFARGIGRMMRYSPEAVRIRHGMMRRRLRGNPGFEPSDYINTEKTKREFLAGYNSGRASRIDAEQGRMRALIKGQYDKNERYLQNVGTQDFERRSYPEVFSMKLAYHLGWRMGWNRSEPPLKYLPRNLR